MAAHLLSRSLRALLCSAFAVLCLAAFSQVDNVYVYGTVKDYVSSKKLDGITVTVFKNGGKLAEVVTNASGKYEFNLDYGSDYKLTYTKPGMVSKNIAIDTRNIPEEERVGGHGMNVEMTLFQELPGIDFTVLQQPIGKAKFDPTTKEVTWDLQYTEQVRAEISRLMKEYDDKKKREANAEEEFAKLLSQGDASMTAGEYKKAVDSFTSALGLKPGDPKATAKLSNARMKLDEVEATEREAAKYTNLIKEADGLFAKKDFAGAKTKYAEAAELKDQEAYPKQKIKECQSFIDELAKKAEEEKKLKELNDKYNAAITAADAAMKADKLDDARTKYTDAAGIKPEEKYPKEQLALIEKKLEERTKKEEAERAKKELDAKYDAFLTAADAAFKSANYEVAKAKYNEALGVKPEEKYPKDQLVAIDKKLEEIAKKEEEDRKRKELDDAYNAAITAGDAAFKQDGFEEAKAKYTEALALKPKEKYPQDQLSAITKRIAELAAKAEEDKRNKELNDKYNEALAAADAAFKGEQWEGAKTKYAEAAKLKPQERYPKDQLAAIDKAIADAAKKAADEERQKQLDAQYQLLLGSADGLFAQNKLDMARAKYQECLELKPEQSYPKIKIEEITTMLAEQARLAEEERKRKELDERYNTLIAKADKSYDTKKLADALNGYKSALELKPDEQHPKDRITDIQGRMDADAQEKAEKDRLEREQKELEKRYKDFISAADASFKSKEYEAAKGSYNEALGVKPEEEYPKSRIADIDRLLAELATKAEADRQKAELEAAERAREEEEKRKKQEGEAATEARYQEAISKADVAFNGERYDEARDGYTEALSIKPGEKYPRKRLEDIEQALADKLKAQMEADAAEAERLRLEEERKRKEAEDAEAARLASDSDRDRMAAEKARNELYEKAIADGDAAMGGEQYDEARGFYTQALDIKPEETYPQVKLDMIDKLLAEAERRRQEAEALAQRAADEPEVDNRKSKTIDPGKEDDAARFMREARKREEEEKWARIRKLRADLQAEEVANTNEALERREQARSTNQTMVDRGASLYEGSQAMRLRNEEELATLKAAWEERHRQVESAGDQGRSGAWQANDELKNKGLEQANDWRNHHVERVNEHIVDKNSSYEAERDRANAGAARSEQALEEVRRQEESRAELERRGGTVGEELRNSVETDRSRFENQHRQMSNRSEDDRLSAMEKLNDLSGSKQRSFSDYNRGQLANAYKQGVTEESYTEGNYVIIRRIKVQGNKADDFKKVIGKAGTSYFRNGLSITEWVWTQETEE